jgi:hypothetical protein
MRWQFVKGTSWTSEQIALFGAGQFSHVDTIGPDERLIGARSDLITVGATTYPAGVQWRPPNYELWAERVIVSLNVTPEQEAAYWAYMDLQIGKPYDKLAIVAFIVGRNWRDDDAWFCSELVIACCEQAGICPLLYVRSNKVTPVACAMVLSALGGVVVSTA